MIILIYTLKKMTFIIKYRSVVYKDFFNIPSINHNLYFILLESNNFKIKS